MPSCRPSPLKAATAIAVASGIWYGAITFFAYRVGDNWDEMSRRVGGASRALGVAAAALALVGGLVVLVRRRRRAAPART